MPNKVFLHGCSHGCSLVEIGLFQKHFATDWIPDLEATLETAAQGMQVAHLPTTAPLAAAAQARFPQMMLVSSRLVEMVRQPGKQSVTALKD